MPIGPSNLQVRHNELNRIMFEIDNILLDPAKSNQCLVGPSDDFFYQFAFPGRLLPIEKQHLVKMYMACGWGKVVVINSNEVHYANDNLILVKLYSKADSMHDRV